MNDKEFLLHVKKIMRQTNLSEDDRKTVILMLKELLKKNSPEEVSNLLLKIIYSAKKS